MEHTAPAPAFVSLPTRIDKNFFDGYLSYINRKSREKCCAPLELPQQLFCRHLIGSCVCLMVNKINGALMMFNILNTGAFTGLSLSLYTLCEAS
jgi:hypothetical protein